MQKTQSKAEENAVFNCGFRRREYKLSDPVSLVLSSLRHTKISVVPQF